jgi:hypothetical protein
LKEEILHQSPRIKRLYGEPTQELNARCYADAEKVIDEIFLVIEKRGGLAEMGEQNVTLRTLEQVCERPKCKAADLFGEE